MPTDPLSSRRENPDMYLFRNVLLVCLSILLWAGPLSGTVLKVTGGGEVKPPDPGYVYNREVFDCTPLMTLPLSVGVSGTLNDDTTGGTNQINSYPCAPWQEEGPEHIYQLVVADGDTLEFWAGLRVLDPPVDHDLFLLNGCDTDSCLIGVNTEFTAVLTGGTYYLVVDGASSSPLYEGPYVLEYSCRYVGVAPLACVPGVVTEVDIEEPESIFDSNLFNQFDAVSNYECSPILMRGGDKWFTLTLPGVVDNQFGGKNYSQFKAEITDLPFTMDIGLWLFDGCGVNPTCLDFVNERIGGVPEILSYRNETDQEITVYLGVDCFTPPSELGTGYFSIKFTTELVVPTEKTSFGSLRALYR